MTSKALPVVGNSNFTWVGWGGENRNECVRFQMIFLFFGLAATNTCLDRMEEISQLAKWLDSQLL